MAEVTTGRRARLLPAARAAAVRVATAAGGRGGAVAILLLLVLGFFIATPDFLTADNTRNVLRQYSVPAILAVGQTLVIISAGIDDDTSSRTGKPKRRSRKDSLINARRSAALSSRISTSVTSRPSLLRGIGLRMAENGGSYIFSGKPFSARCMYVIQMGSAAALPVSAWAPVAARPRPRPGSRG